MHQYLVGIKHTKPNTMVQTLPDTISPETMHTKPNTMVQTLPDTISPETMHAKPNTMVQTVSEGIHLSFSVPSSTIRNILV